MVFLGFVRWLEDERQTEVAQFGVAIGVNQDILRLEISVDDAQTMKSFEAQNHISCVKFDLLQVKPSLLFKEHE